MTISSSTGNITSIVFSFNNTTTTLESDSGTYESGVWSGDASSVTFTAGASLQILSITIE
ncbi:MAG: hypothetical protein SNJ35_07025 [Rikenellaceae bacterium]